MEERASGEEGRRGAGSHAAIGGAESRIGQADSRIEGALTQSDGGGDASRVVDASARSEPAAIGAMQEEMAGPELAAAVESRGETKITTADGEAVMSDADRQQAEGAVSPQSALPLSVDKVSERVGQNGQSEAAAGVDGGVVGQSTEQASVGQLSQQQIVGQASVEDHVGQATEQAAERSAASADAISQGLGNPDLLIDGDHVGPNSTTQDLVEGESESQPWNDPATKKGSESLLGAASETTRKPALPEGGEVANDATMSSVGVASEQQQEVSHSEEPHKSASQSIVDGVEKPGQEQAMCEVEDAGTESDNATPNSLSGNSNPPPSNPIVNLDGSLSKPNPASISPQNDDHANAGSSSVLAVPVSEPLQIAGPNVPVAVPVDFVPPTSSPTSSSASILLKSEPALPACGVDFSVVAQEAEEGEKDCEREGAQTRGSSGQLELTGADTSTKEGEGGGQDAETACAEKGVDGQHAREEVGQLEPKALADRDSPGQRDDAETVCSLDVQQPAGSDPSTSTQDAEEGVLKTADGGLPLGVSGAQDMVEENCESSRPDGKEVQIEQEQQQHEQQQQQHEQQQQQQHDDTDKDDSTMGVGCVCQEAATATAAPTLMHTEHARDPTQDSSMPDASSESPGPAMMAPASHMSARVGADGHLLGSFLTSAIAVVGGASDSVVEPEAGPGQTEGQSGGEILEESAPVGYEDPLGTTQQVASGEPASTAMTVAPIALSNVDVLVDVGVEGGDSQQRAAGDTAVGEHEGRAGAREAVSEVNHGDNEEKGREAESDVNLSKKEVSEPATAGGVVMEERGGSGAGHRSESMRGEGDEGGDTPSEPRHTSPDTREGERESGSESRNATELDDGRRSRGGVDQEKDSGGDASAGIGTGPAHGASGQEGRAAIGWGGDRSASFSNKSGGDSNLKGSGGVGAGGGWGAEQWDTDTEDDLQSVPREGEAARESETGDQMEDPAEEEVGEGTGETEMESASEAMQAEEQPASVSEHDEQLRAMEMDAAALRAERGLPRASDGMKEEDDEDGEANDDDGDGDGGGGGVLHESDADDCLLVGDSNSTSARQLSREGTEFSTPPPKIPGLGWGLPREFPKKLLYFGTGRDVGEKRLYSIFESLLSEAINDEYQVRAMEGMTEADLAGLTKHITEALDHARGIVFKFLAEHGPWTCSGAEYRDFKNGRRFDVQRTVRQCAELKCGSMYPAADPFPQPAIRPSGGQWMVVENEADEPVPDPFLAAGPSSQLAPYEESAGANQLVMGSKAPVFDKDAPSYT